MGIVCKAAAFAGHLIDKKGKGAEYLCSLYKVIVLILFYSQERLTGDFQYYVCICYVWLQCHGCSKNLKATFTAIRTVTIMKDETHNYVIQCVLITYIIFITNSTLLVFQFSSIFSPRNLSVFVGFLFC